MAGVPHTSDGSTHLSHNKVDETSTDASVPPGGAAQIRAPRRGGAVWRYFGDARATLMAPQLLLLQVSHPVVGAGVADHSAFRADPWGRGRAYHALTPAYYAWVHATAFPSFLQAAHYLSRPLDAAGQRRLYDELLRLGDILGIKRRDMPATVEEYWPYFDAVLHEELERTAAVSELLDPRRPIPPPEGARPWLRALWPVVHPPLARLHVFVTTGLLPPVAREHFGLAWTVRDERRLRRFVAVVRAVVPLLPERLRYLPLAYEARRAASRA